jgi:hypothetical protein
MRTWNERYQDDLSCTGADSHSESMFQTCLFRHGVSSCNCQNRKMVQSFLHDRPSFISYGRVGLRGCFRRRKRAGYGGGSFVFSHCRRGENPVAREGTVTGAWQLRVKVLLHPLDAPVPA